MRDATYHMLHGDAQDADITDACILSGGCVAGDHAFLKRSASDIFFHGGPAYTTEHKPSAAHKTLPLRADVLLCNTLFEELDDGISEEFLQQYTGNEDLESVDRLEIQVDAVNGAQHVESIGHFLPNLQHLRLNQSHVSTLRDLGTSLKNLRVLWLSRSGLQDLSGITAMPFLEELYVSFNDISQLSTLCMHEGLQVLDIEGNQIDDFGEVQFLREIPTLRELNMTLNPVWKQKDVSRALVLKELPQVEVLDDIPRGQEPCDLEGASDNEACFVHNHDDLLTGAPHSFDLHDGESSDVVGRELHALQRLRKRAGSNLGPVHQADNAHRAAGVKDAWGPMSAVEELAAKRLELHSSSGGDKGSTLNEDVEPNEHELIVEGLKKVRQPVPSLWTHRSSTDRSNYRPASRSSLCDHAPRKAWGSVGSISTAYRPGTASSCASSRGSLQFSHGTASLALQEQDSAASDLTSGDNGGPLVGAPLEAIRRRRRRALGSSGACSDLGIREMLQQAEPLVSDISLPDTPMEESRCESLELVRVGTPDVRVRRIRPATGSPHTKTSKSSRGRIGEQVPDCRRPSVPVIVSPPSFSFPAGEVLLLE